MWSGWGDQKVDCDMWSDLVATCDQIRVIRRVSDMWSDPRGPMCPRHVIRLPLRHVIRLVQIESDRDMWSGFKRKKLRKRNGTLAKTLNFNLLKLKTSCKSHYHWKFICQLVEFIDQPEIKSNSCKLTF